jgi:hypothetical protein
MKIEQHVLYAIDDFSAGKPDAAVMHACLAIEGTATKKYTSGGKANYKNASEPIIGSWNT